jgi:hypothetical protein
LALVFIALLIPLKTPAVEIPAEYRKFIQTAEGQKNRGGKGYVRI